jgi:hypothetical protein
VRHQVADGGDGLQIWREAANILNKQSWTADKGWSSSLEVGCEASNSSNNVVTKDHKKPRTGTDSLDKQPMRKKMDMRFGTRNVGTMCRAGLLRAMVE